MSAFSPLSPRATYLTNELDKTELKTTDEKIAVNPVISEVAAWYENLRNALEYKEDEVILRAAIERILKRRLLLGGRGIEIAEPLVRELVWARYFPDGSVPEAIIEKVARTINLHLDLYNEVTTHHKLNKSEVYEWILHVLTGAIEDILRPSPDKELLINFIFQILCNSVVITDEPAETKDAQVYIAVRRAFGKEDLALLRYNLFLQFFGKLTDQSLQKIADTFTDGYNEINNQLNHKHKDKIYSYVKNQMPPFFILEEVFRKHKGSIKELVLNERALELEVMRICSEKYKNIFDKVQRGIVRSVIFIFITKAIFGLSIEVTLENLIYQEVFWYAIAANTLFSPLMMIIAGLFIKLPEKENSVLIWEKIKAVLYSKQTNFSKTFTINENIHKVGPIRGFIYASLWILALMLGLGFIILVLRQLGFKPVSQVIFIFFLTVVSFLSYRIGLTARTYTVVKEKHGFRAVFFDFFFMPFIQLGRNFTVGISKINIFLFIFDYIIETPFKEMFSFFEQWFLFLRRQRETLE